MPVHLSTCVSVCRYARCWAYTRGAEQTEHTHKLNTAGQNYTHTHKLLLFWEGQSDCEVGRWTVADRCHTAPGNTPCFVCTLSRLDKIASQKRRWRRTHVYKNHTQTQRSWHTEIHRAQKCLAARLLLCLLYLQKAIKNKSLKGLQKVCHPHLG